MSSHPKQGGSNRKTNLITKFFKATKSQLIPSDKGAVASPSVPCSSPTSSSPVPPLLGSAFLKRRASTSAPSSPTTIRPARKRSIPTWLSPSPGLRDRLTLRPKVFAPPADSWLSPLEPDGESILSLGSASDRSVSVSCISTDSLAPGGSKARAPGARARRDAADARRVIRTIKQVKENKYEKKSGLGGKYLIHRTLHPSGYKYLREVELKKPDNAELWEYFNGDKFRFDYTRRPCKGDKQFVIRMPSNFHESMAGELQTIIDRWLGEILNGTAFGVESPEKSKEEIEKSRTETKRIAREIHPTLATRVEYREPHLDRLEPDLSFTYEACEIADLVVEVAWSQRALKLADRARRYIEGTKGAIQTVVGLDMNDIYLGGHRATFSIWKGRHYDDRWSYTLVDNQEFIDGNGQVIDNCELFLSLKDFICTEEESQCDGYENIPLKITSTKLYEIYTYALGQQMAHEANKGIETMQEKTNDTWKKMLSIETAIQMKDDSDHIIMGEEDLASLRAKMSEVEQDIISIKEGMVEGVEKKINKLMQERKKST
ncbi:hypothetical protein NUW58_g5095 [Xylaria curta]|uniref:Uncharacterized protein n=1 Tax=Xylaria curta TaxID=42375 RepID=A0ACC1P3A1_9PEZI|nr:hypothetical protein NUW58_g5095 [Xylaria curta]